MRVTLLGLLVVVLGAACASLPSTTARTGTPAWSIALHGGAGVIPKNLKPEEIAAYHAALDGALAEGIRRAERGQSALDIAEAVVRILEDEPRFNAGRGAAFTADGTHELDACVMVGSGLKTGAVAGVKTVRHPVSLARLVMEKTRHVLLAADGAEAFADLMKVERVPNTWFDTELRRGYLEEWRAAQKTHAAAPVRGENAYGTVGCVVRDAKGELAAATSTGGLTGKRWGRIGDAPIAGAGTFADARCAVSCSGTGEVFIRHGVAREVSNRMRHFGEDATTAARRVIDALEPGDGGLIVVAADGSIAYAFNTEGLYRGFADANGRRETAIWED